MYCTLVNNVLIVLNVCVGSSASVCSWSIHKAADAAYCDDCSDPVKGVIVVSLYQPSCVSLAQGTFSLVSTGPEKSKIHLLIFQALISPELVLRCWKNEE